MWYLNVVQLYVIVIGKVVYVKFVVQLYIYCCFQFCFGLCEIIGVCDFDVVFVVVNDFDGDVYGVSDFDVICGVVCQFFMC